MTSFLPVRTIIALTVRPISNAAGRTARNPQPIALRSCFEQGNEAFILYDCQTKDGSGARNTEFFTIEGNKIKEIEVYFGSASNDASKR
jgi:hypothetical protein